MRARFVCVRITKMNDQDIARFDFDLDTTWSAFFLDSDLNIYSRYGGRDHREPEDRMSKESLLQTMREVLEVHNRRNKLSADDLQSLFHPGTAEPQVPDDIPLLKQGHRGCLHCHQVREYQLLQWGLDGGFDRRKLFRWPVPESLGIVLEHQHGHRIEAVEPSTAADAAGLKPGDMLTRVNDVPIHSELDIRWALDQADDDRPLRFLARRSDESGKAALVEIDVQPSDDWRVTDLGWRKSLRSLPIEWGIRAYPLSASQRDKEGYGRDQLALRVTWVRQRGLAMVLKLEKKDVIVALEGKSTNRRLSEFQSDLLARYQPGDEVHVSVIRDGAEVELTGEFPQWHTTQDTVP